MFSTRVRNVSAYVVPARNPGKVDTFRALATDAEMVARARVSTRESAP